MAYANLINQANVNPLETFQRFRNFLCKRKSSNDSYDYSLTGIGWTLFDSHYTTNEYTITVGDWFVAYSPGEDGLRDLYIRVVFTSVSSWNVTGYLSWDAATNTGTQAYGGGAWANTTATNNTLWIYGDLDAVIAFTKYGTTYNTARFGWMPDSPIDQSITNYASAITSGANKTLTFASVPVAWSVGTKLFAWDATNIERVEISNISGNDVTFASFASAYSGGADFSMERTDYCHQHATSASTSVLISHAGVKNDPLTPDVTYILDPSSGDGLTGLYPAKKHYYSDATTWMGPMKNVLVSTALAADFVHTYGGVNYRSWLLFTCRLLLKEV